MGRYRELVRNLIYYSNNSNRNSKSTLDPVDDVALSKREYQILEYLVEFEKENRIMTDISRDLGIIQSNVTSATKNLVLYGLIERYKIVGNQKNIILKPTAKGKRIYHTYVERDIAAVFRPFFAVMDSYTDEEIADFAKAIDTLNHRWAEFSDEIEEKLIKSK